MIRLEVSLQEARLLRDAAQEKLERSTDQEESVVLENLVNYIDVEV